MIRMSKFRNVIVHDYVRVDPTIVVQILREHLEDFTRWLRGDLNEMKPCVSA
jgi:uncharacterized protein YutE (UPF0331/DUF86 family)